MTIARLRAELDPLKVGENIYRLIEQLYPFCRSLTGDGVRQTLSTLQSLAPLTIHEVPTGTRVFDWTVPNEWNIRDAYVKNSAGERVIDFRRSTLHVVGYSKPIRATVSLAELKQHLFTLPEHPAWIPYRTSYNKETWGFCLSHNAYVGLTDGSYEVCIDSTLAPGSLTYGECYLAGDTQDEVLISAHICHPSMCNDNLSGIAVAARLAHMLSRVSHRQSYRFVFAPATLGAITWLALNEARLPQVSHGLVLACAGDSGQLTYKKSRRGNALIDRVACHVLKGSGTPYLIEDFSPYGYDERQFCSPAFDLPMGCLMRTPHGRFREYHTSADNLDFVHPEQLGDTFAACLAIFDVLENNASYVNLNPKCEPELGRRGLYRGYPHGGADDLALLWVLNLSDGLHSLLDIAERSGLRFDVVQRAAMALHNAGLVADAASVAFRAAANGMPQS